MVTGVSNKIHVRLNNISFYNMLQCTEISSKKIKLLAMLIKIYKKVTFISKFFTPARLINVGDCKSMVYE